MVLKTYYLTCIFSLASRKVAMTNKVLRDKSRCAECLSDKSRFMKQKHNNKLVSSIIEQTC